MDVVVRRMDECEAELKIAGTICISWELATKAKREFAELIERYQL